METSGSASGAVQSAPRLVRAQYAPPSTTGWMGARLSTGWCHRLDGCSSFSPDTWPDSTNLSLVFCLFYLFSFFFFFSQRNWHWDEPSCGGEMCVVLYYQPSAPPDEDGHFLFQWNDNNCNSKNNFVCKYSEGESELSWERAGNGVAFGIPGFILIIH